MKKVCLTMLSVCLAVTALPAQSMYFDIGLGLGDAATEIDKVNVDDQLDPSYKKTSVDMGLKVGYGPIADMPIYVVAEISGMGHRYENSNYMIQFNSFLLGPGILFYPFPILQIAASVGYSFVSNTSNMPITFYDSNGGIAGDVSVALDFGKRNNGFLLGARYCISSNTLEVSEVEQKTTMITGFIKYAYREKVKKD